MARWSRLPSSLACMYLMLSASFSFLGWSHMATHCTTNSFSKTLEAGCTITFRTILMMSSGSAFVVLPGTVGLGAVRSCHLLPLPRACNLENSVCGLSFLGVLPRCSSHLYRSRQLTLLRLLPNFSLLWPARGDCQRGPRSQLGAAWPIRTRNERVVPFVVSGLGDHVRQMVLFDPSYDGSQLYAMGVQPGLYAEDLMSNNYRQCGLTLWVNGVHMSAVVRPLRTGDYVQLLPDRPTQASTAAHPEELLGAINRLRAFSAPLPVPSFPISAARGSQDEARTRARAALIHAMDLATRARVEMMGLPARVSQAITLLEPGRAPHHLHLPASTDTDSRRG